MFEYDSQVFLLLLLELDLNRQFSLKTQKLKANKLKLHLLCVCMCVLHYLFAVNKSHQLKLALMYGSLPSVHKSATACATF